MTEKLDLKKELKHLYRPSAKKAETVDVPMMSFLMIDGEGNPNTSPDYQAAVEALYGTAYTLKFACKKQLGRDFTVMPLQGLWWGISMHGGVLSEADKDQFEWTMMIMQPDFVTDEMVTAAVEEVERKKGLPALANLRFEPFAEGLAVQILHVGPYDAEGPTIERLHSYAESQGYRLSGKHHEIYLSDPRRAAPEKLKTIIRHPVEKVEHKPIGVDSQMCESEIASSLRSSQ